MWFWEKTLLSISNRFRESEVNFSNDYGNQKLDLEAKEAKDRFCKVAGLLWVCFAPQSCCGRHELSCRQSSWNEMQCFQILYWLDFCFAVTFEMCQHCDPSMFRDREIRPLPCLQRGMAFIGQTHYLRLLWDSCWLIDLIWLNGFNWRARFTKYSRWGTNRPFWQTFHD